MRKIAVVFLVFLFLFTCFSVTVGAIKIWPGKHYITINRWYEPGENVRNPKIQITNTESYDMNISVRIDNPSVPTLDPGYSVIPDTSWIKTVPEVVFVPAGSSEFIEVIIEVPESQQSLHYNEKWETLVVISEPIESGGGINIQTEIGVKIFIQTPEGEILKIQYTHILIAIIIPLLIIFMVAYILKRKRRSN